MLKVIKRVLRLSGDLSKRIYASFVFSFIDSIMASNGGQGATSGIKKQVV